jgi:lipoprotein-anchoring transpeptidase ErfK/SrfK
VSAATVFFGATMAIGLTDQAHAQGYYYQVRPDYYQARPDYYPARPDPRLDIAPVPRPLSRSVPNSDVKSKAEPAKDFGAMPKGPLQIVVSIANQHVTLYSNGVLVAQGPVSTGIPGKPTPTGVFSIIQKDRFHHSNLYSNAPMPFMERITWSGVALHEGPLPGYPASHGCIRMTHEFAERLWGVARLGVRVIVARTDVEPAEFSHPHLFEPVAKPTAVEPDPGRRAGAPEQVKVAQATPAEPAVKDAGELRGTVEPTRTGSDEAPASSADTTSAASEIKPADPDPEKPAPDASDPPKQPPALKVPKGRAAGQPAKHSGQVAIFISRKEKRLYVRQGFAPLFDTPVEIERPERPLGTHVFTALGLTDNGLAMRWNVMSIPVEAPRPIAPKIGPGKKPAVAGKPVESIAPSTAGEALDRIHIPEEAASRIGEILVPGSSLVIADQGLGDETGQGTEFIVLTH